MIEKYKKKYSSLPIPAKAALWFTICSIFQRGIQFIVVPLYTRILSTQEYGTYSVFLSWTEIVRIFCTLNLYYNSFNVGITKFEKDKDKYTSSVLGLSYLFTAIFTLFYIVFNKYFNKFFGMSTMLCFAMIFFIFIESSYRFWSASQRYEYRYKMLIFTTLFISIGNPALALLFIKLSYNNTLSVIFSKLIIEVLLGIPALIYIICKGKKIYDKYYWKYGLKNNIPLIPYYLSQIILNHSDKLMINKYCGVEEAGIYSVAYSSAMMLNIINTSINNSIIPWKFKKLKEKSYEGIHEITYSMMLIVMFLNLILIALAPEAMNILASKEYYEAIWLIPPVACSSYLLFVSQQFINIEFYFEENRFVAFSSIFIAILNIILNYILLPQYGYIIAGYTTLFSYIVFTIVHYFAMRHILRKHTKDIQIWNIKQIILLSMIFMLLSLLMLLCYENNILRYIFVIIITLVVYRYRRVLLNIKNLKVK